MADAANPNAEIARRQPGPSRGRRPRRHLDRRARPTTSWATPASSSRRQLLPRERRGGRPGRRRGSGSRGCRSARSSPRLARPRRRSGPWSSPRVRRRWRALHHPAGPRMTDLKIWRAIVTPPDSPARVEPPTRPPWRVGLVQHRWHPDPGDAPRPLAAGVRLRRGGGRRGSCACRSSRSRRTSRITPDGAERGGRASTRGASRRADLRVRRRARGRDGRAGARVAVRAAAPTAGSASTPRSASRPTVRCSRAHPQDAPPGDRGLLRGPLLPARRQRLPASSSVDEARARLPDVLGRVVPGGRSRLLARGRRGARLPDRDRLRARPPRTSTPSRCGSR